MKTEKDVVKLRGELVITLENVKTGKKRVSKYKNMVVTLAKNSIADALRGNTASNKGIITYCALGTGITAPALSDTQLQTEIFRKAISVRSSQNNTAIFQTFFGASEAIGTLREAGLFGDDASLTANSGTLFCRAAMNRTKSAADTLSIAWYVTIG